MGFKVPVSMDECFYFTNRSFENSGKASAWVYKPVCPKCKKGKMSKPLNDKTGKVIKKAEEYVCPECGHTENIEEYDNTLSVEVIYTCPYCKSSGETTTIYKRKNFKGVPAYVFSCLKCGEKIGLTKKLKTPKK